MKQITHLTDPDFTHKGVADFNLSVEEYARVLDSVVIANVDIILHKTNGDVLLGTRVDKPLQNKLWIFGGRMKPGDSINDAARRNIKREVGIKADESRLVFSNIYNIMWAGRAEVPQDHGFQTMISILKYECTPEEIEQSRAADDTHSHMRWYTQDELQQLEAAGELHEFLVTVLRDAELL